MHDVKLLSLICVVIMVSCTKPSRVHRLWEQPPELKAPSDYSDDVVAAMDSLYGPSYRFYNDDHDRYEVEWQAVDSSEGEVVLKWRYVVERVLETDTMSDGSVRTWFVTYSTTAGIKRGPTLDFCVAVRRPDGHLRAISMSQSGLNLYSLPSYKLVTIGPKRKAFMFEVYDGGHSICTIYTFMIEPRDSMMHVVGAFHTTESDDGVEVPTGTSEISLIPMTSTTDGVYDLLALRRDTRIHIVKANGEHGEYSLDDAHVEHPLPYRFGIIRYSAATDCYILPYELQLQSESLVRTLELAEPVGNLRRSWRSYTTPEHVDSLLRYPKVYVPDYEEMDSLHS